MDLKQVFRKPRLLRALTTLEPGEFERLLTAFEAAWQGQRDARTHDGGKRRRAPGAGHKGTLSTPRAKLFFLLFYFKCYPLQEVMALLFGLGQPQVCFWIGRLTPLVNAALGHELMLPARRPANLKKLLEEVPDLMAIIDGTERPIRRPKNPDDQTQDYSGKKKAHRKKNLLVSMGPKVAYLGRTAPGSVHDKKLADQARLRFAPGTLLLKDSGFQGYEPKGIKTLQPKKKPKGGELNLYDQARNRIISRFRIGAEHVICGIKRCRIVADTFRNWRKDLVDEVMLAASGLHNLRVTHRILA